MEYRENKCKNDPDPITFNHHEFIGYFRKPFRLQHLRHLREGGTATKSYGCGGEDGKRADRVEPCT